MLLIECVFLEEYDKAKEYQSRKAFRSRKKLAKTSWQRIIKHTDWEEIIKFIKAVNHETGDIEEEKVKYEPWIMETTTKLNSIKGKHSHTKETCQNTIDRVV